jgi:methylmalonyl-CoA mutase cobalamin-binding domain/chain
MTQSPPKCLPTLCVGLSILSGSQITLTEEVHKLLRSEHMPLIVGGIVPPADAERLKAAGVAASMPQRILRSTASAARSTRR